MRDRGILRLERLRAPFDRPGTIRRRCQSPVLGTDGLLDLYDVHRIGLHQASLPGIEQLRLRQRLDIRLHRRGNLPLRRRGCDLRA